MTDKSYNFKTSTQKDIKDGYNSMQHIRQVWKERDAIKVCLNEEMDKRTPEHKRGEPRLLACPCPKCTTWC